MKDKNLFSKHGLLEKNFETMQKHLRAEDQQFIVVVVGETGSSKTSLSLLLDHYLNNGEVNLETYCMTHDRFMEEYQSRPVKKTIIMEEGRESFDKNKHSHSSNKEARDSLRQYRKYQHTVFINFQDAKDLQPELVNNIAHCMLRTPGKGKAWFYGKKSMRKMWSGKDFKGWSDPDFKDYFPDPAGYIPEVWGSYEEKAMEELDESKSVEDKSDSSDKFDKYYGTKDIADLFSVTTQTVREWVKQEDYKVKRLASSGEIRIPEPVVKELRENKLKE